MGRRAFTNPSKIESETERARNCRRRQQQKHQNLARQERIAYPGRGPNKQSVINQY
ncbi:hypothetical protein QL093DRAFT_2101650 [Fusarium oxysporum]|nr:hypothetical protein QL093DRAFT_2101650 [Fusarium oxysporum]